MIQLHPINFIIMRYLTHQIMEFFIQVLAIFIQLDEQITNWLLDFQNKKEQKTQSVFSISVTYIKIFTRHTKVLTELVVPYNAFLNPI